MMYRLIYRNFATCSTAVKGSRGILPALVALSGAAALGRKLRFLIKNALPGSLTAARQCAIISIEKAL